MPAATRIKVESSVDATETRSGRTTRQANRLTSHMSQSVSRPRGSERDAAADGDEDRKRVKVEHGEVKAEEEDALEVKPDVKPTVSKATGDTLSDRKLAAYTKHSSSSPFPTFNRPTRSEAKLAHSILASKHGSKVRPATIVASSSRAGCGDSPSVLDALVRTILSQNTSDVNSSRAKRSMDAAYGSSDNWAKVVEGGQAKLQEAIKCGGLAVVKSRVILSILEQVHAKHDTYSLDHLFKLSNDDAMREMLSFQGVGPKTASCVLLFCLGRESFAVDTHVHRITGLLGWRPAKASRDETHAHLEARIPDEDKYALHVLFVQHGKVCPECKAGGRVKGECELRRAFPGGKVKVE